MISMLLPTLALVLPTYDPREFVEYDGVLMPLTRTTVIAHLISCALMLGSLTIMALRGPPDRRDADDNGTRWDHDASGPFTPRWPSDGRLGRLRSERPVAWQPCWN